MRKALVIGIDYYENGNNLYGCVNDANAVKSVLERNSDGTKNFDVKLFTATSEDSAIKKYKLKEYVIDLFENSKDEIALFYFSGHGYIDNTGGQLITSDFQNVKEGFSMNDLLTISNKSEAKNKIIILDCCHSGYAGNSPYSNSIATLYNGTTILTASSDEQYAMEENGSGVFTNLFIDAMNGSAANLIGDITPGSVYAHIDQSLGPWEQRPIFKTNVENFTTLRKVTPSILLSELHMITDLFSEPSEEFQLDPEYEPDEKYGVIEKEKKFRILQKYNRVNLVVPVGEEHMYYAAVNSKSCKLTILGEHYWNLVKKDRI